MKKAYIVAVDMGYGHKRAAFPLQDIAAVPEGWEKSGMFASSQVLCANIYPGIPTKDRGIWQKTQSGYEAVSRFKDVPLIGEIVFGIADYFQNIFSLYPMRDASKPTFQLKQIYNWIDNGWGRHLIDELNKNPLPYIATFFTPAFFAEEHGYKGDIYLLCTDTDVSRAWAPMHPEVSRIKYLAPTYRVALRLKSYGIKPENIILTGFPLPKEVVPAEGDLKLLKEQTSRRAQVLDPHNVYADIAEKVFDAAAGSKNLPVKPISLVYAIGGAGAGKDIGLKALKSLVPHIKNGKISFTLVAGSNKELFETFTKAISDNRLDDMCGNGVEVLYNADKDMYLRAFNELIPSIDILWTKPSELSFYSRLGLPILMAPAVGAQERCNIEYLYQVGAGIKQDKPETIGEWLFEWIDSGIFARMAINGYAAPLKYGTQEIEKIINNKE